MTPPALPILIKTGAASDVGLRRQINQDHFGLFPARHLYLVADGMGGHQGGEVASRLAIDTLDLAYQNLSTDSLIDAIAVANHRIRNDGNLHANLRGMGTTLVAVALLPAPVADDAGEPSDASRSLVITNVGDSRCYAFRHDALVQLTEDHSVVADLVREGQITLEEAEVHPQRNIVTRVLGIYETVEAYVCVEVPVPGDRYLLCSDGLFNEVSHDQITAVLRRLADPQEAAEELVRMANAGGGRDNITVVLLDVLNAQEIPETVSPTATVPTATPTPRQQRRANRSRGSRFTWRTALFLLLLIAVLGGAVATIQWYGTSTYFVGFQGDDVVIYQGRPGGLLWIDPTLVERTTINRRAVPPSYTASLTAGNEQPSLAAARLVVANIERDRDRDAAREASTPTTTTTTTPPTTAN
ncbi:MAG: serine/threonine-protein phosphatase [Acidimicrobiia bacterium]|nr:serine/threonine-protein phosphatase [Acidimicrobiia bacterium]